MLQQQQRPPGAVSWASASPLRLPQEFSEGLLQVPRQDFLAAQPLPVDSVLPSQQLTEHLVKPCQTPLLARPL